MSDGGLRYSYVYALSTIVPCNLYPVRVSGHFWTHLIRHMVLPTFAMCVQWDWWLGLGWCRLHGDLFHGHQDRVLLFSPHQFCYTHVPITHHSECSRVTVEAYVVDLQYLHMCAS